jgi:hypothetical protein
MTRRRRRLRATHEVSAQARGLLEQPAQPPGVPAQRPARETRTTWPPERRELARELLELGPVGEVDDQFDHSADAVLFVSAPSLLAEAMAEIARLEVELADVTRERDALLVSGPGAMGPPPGTAHPTKGAAMDFPKEIFVTAETDPHEELVEFLVIVGSIVAAAEPGQRVRVARYQLVEEGHVEAPASFVPGPSQ